MNGKERNGGGVPPRWLKCPRKSEGFIAQKFLVFKTPLSPQYDEAVPVQYRFYPNMISDYVKNQKMKLGLWIDLTNTSRFYPKEQIEEQSARYVKLQCRGHGEAPSEDQVKTFNRICEQFMDQFPDDVIGVHCTHGFNRSGYLICAFLCSTWDWSVNAALGHFAKLRPPGIYKQMYIDQLFQVYGSPDDGPVPRAPELPSWCHEDEDVEDDDGFASSSNGHSSKAMNKRGIPNSGDPDLPPPKRRREMFKANPTFMEGVSGVYPVTDMPKLTAIQRKVQDMCEWRGSGFPGSQPVSMDVNNIRLLHEKPYMVSWKADGTRYLMLIDGPEQIYFIDRDNCVFHSPHVSFRRRSNLQEHIASTLVDGEMVLDKVNDQVIPRYLIYDIIKFRGEDVGKRDFRTRLTCINEELVKPRVVAIEKGLINRTQEPFGIRFKPFWFVEDTQKILTGKFAKELIHEPDGTIFQPCRDPYKAGRCDDVLKWKPPHLNTVDFRLKIVEQSGIGLLPTKIGQLFVGGLDQPFAAMKITKSLPPGLHGKIVECKWDDQQRTWVFLRERTDKSFPNAFTTAKAVVHSITHPVTQDFLLNYIAHHRYVKR